MARKISGPFTDVSIQSVGNVGTTTSNNEVFHNLIHNEMAIYKEADKFSSAHLVDFVERVKKKQRLKKGSKTKRDNTRKINPLIDLLGPQNYINRVY
tara:strand:- start:791 stop:1081 length:291 start_codon:yes stop_codon:yes gene_type:complete